MCIREDGQVLLHGDSHMATARLDYKEALVGPGWVPWLHELTQNKLLSPCRSSFLTEEGVWVLNGCLLAKSAEYCMLVDEEVWLMSQVCLLWLKVHLCSVLDSGL